MRVWAIDPGPEQSGWVVILGEPERPEVLAHGLTPNADLLGMLRAAPRVHLVAIERIVPWARQAGHALVDTCVWIGRFWQAAEDAGARVLLVPRNDVARWLTGDRQAPKRAVRDELVHRYGPGRERAVGRKAAPGPLYGLRVHEYDALALACYVADAMVGTTA